MQNNFPEDRAKFKLLIADYDGTLAGVDHVVTPVVEAAVKKWIDSGRYFSIATGRQFGMINEDCKKLSLKTPVITRGGAEIVDPTTGKIISAELIDKKSIGELMTIFFENNLSFLVEHGNVLYTNFKYVLDFPNVMKKELEDFETQDAPKMVVKAYDHDYEKVHKLMDEIENSRPYLSILRTHNKFGYGWDITSVKATKLHGVVHVMEYVNVKREEVVGVGDSYNDFPLLEASGFKVAMANGHQEVKEIADVIVPSHDEDGVAYLIDQLLNEN
ncbi:MAG: HAD family hydrolase [Candidatus Levybacteria bacterium]|nr:HAD family hydrolase [Candidatus Levybacteria bacterium]